MWKFLMILIIIVGFVGTSVFAIESTNNDTKKFLDNAEKALENKNYELVLKNLDSVLEIEPDNIEVLRNKGAILGITEKYDEAIKIFDKILVIEPNNTLALYNKARALYNLEKYYEASIFLDQALILDGDNIQFIKLKYDILNKSKEKIDGILQIQIRNSDGRLVGYIESDRINMWKNFGLDVYLSQLPIKNLVESDGEKFAIVNLDEDVIISEEPSDGNFYGGVKIMLNYTGNSFPVVWAELNGIPITLGDKLSHSWNLIIPWK